MRRLITAVSVVLALTASPMLLAAPASASISGICGSKSLLSGDAPYNDDTLLQHLVSARGTLACGPYPASHQWKVKVVLQQYYLGAWHSVASTTSGWRSAKSGTVTTNPASVYCIVALIPYKFRAQSTGYWRSSSKSATTTLRSTFSSTTTRYC